MKKHFLLMIASFVLAMSCKKSGDGLSNTLMLGEVYKNGLLEAEYFYSNKKLVRQNQYNVSNSQGKLSLYILYEYDQNDKIEKKKIFAPNDTLNNTTVFSYDNAARISRTDFQFNGTLFYYTLYEYDAQNRFEKITDKDGGNNANQDYTQYAYDNEGRLTSQQQFIWHMNTWKKSSYITYIPAGKNTYAHWQSYTISPFDMYRSELNMASKQTLGYDNNETLTTERKDSAHNKQYNGAGYLISQTITRKYIKPAKADEVFEMEYKYVQ